MAVRLSRLLCDHVGSAGVPLPPVSAFRLALISCQGFRSTRHDVVWLSFLWWWFGIMVTWPPQSRGDVPYSFLHIRVESVSFYQNVWNSPVSHQAGSFLSGKVLKCSFSVF